MDGSSSHSCLGCSIVLNRRNASVYVWILHRYGGYHTSAIYHFTCQVCDLDMKNKEVR